MIKIKMIDLGQVGFASFTRRYIVYALLAVIAVYILTFSLFQAEMVFKGFLTVIFLDFIFTETRMIVMHNPFSFRFLDNLNEEKAYFQSALTTVSFLLYGILLFVVVVLKVDHGFFFGFFIAYFADIIILVLASYRKQIN